jgi:hypothetical protein
MDNNNERVIKYLTNELVNEKLKNAELQDQLNYINQLKVYIEENPTLQFINKIPKPSLNQESPISTTTQKINSSTNESETYTTSMIYKNIKIKYS